MMYPTTQSLDAYEAFAERSGYLVYTVHRREWILRKPKSITLVTFKKYQLIDTLYQKKKKKKSFGPLRIPSIRIGWKFVTP